MSELGGGEKFVVRKKNDSNIMGQENKTRPSSSNSRRGISKNDSSRQVKVRIKRPSSAPRTTVSRYKPKTQVVNVQQQKNSSTDPIFMNCHEVTKFLEEGPCGFRTLSAVGALFSFVAACLDYSIQEAYYGVELMFLIATAYILLFTFFMMTLGKCSGLTHEEGF